MANPTPRRFKQMIIYLLWKGQQYNIRAESIKPTVKQEEEEYTATNNIKPYAKAFEGQSYEFDLSGVDPLQYPIFKEIMKEQAVAENVEMFSLSRYGYDENHKLSRMDWYGGCTITELSNETAEPFDVKCTAINWS